MIRSLPYSCGLRVIRTCSELEDRYKNLHDMMEKFKRRQYPSLLLEEVKNRLLLIDRNDIIKPTSSLHIKHLSMHSPAILDNRLDTTNIQRETNNNKVFIIFPFIPSPSIKQTLKSMFTNELSKCRSEYLRSMVMDININIAFTIPNQIGRIITGIENRNKK